MVSIARCERGMHMLRVVTCALAGSTALLLSAPALGEESRAAQPADEEKADSVPPAAQPGGKIEEIEVLGEKKKELQKLPLSLVKFGTEQLRQQQVRRIDDIGKSVANLKFDTVTGNNNAPRIFVRGVGQDSGATNFEPGVLLYVDDVYLPFSTGALFSTVDLQEVEVRRGPQGTSGGKNSVGGSIRAYTRKPISEMGAYVEASVGNLDLFRTESTFNVPLGFGPLKEKAFTRLSFASETDDGYVRNQIDGEHAGDTKLLAGRAALRLLPTEDLELNLSWERAKEDEALPIGKCEDVRPFVGNRLILDTVFDFANRCERSRSGSGLDEVQSDDVPNVDIDSQGLTSNIDWNVGGWKVRSITGWRELNFRLSPGDLDNTDAVIVDIDTIRNERRAMSQELRFERELLDSRLKLSGGIYGFKEQGSVEGGFSQFASVVENPDQPLALPADDPIDFGDFLPDDVGLPMEELLGTAGDLLPPDIVAQLIQLGFPADSSILTLRDSVRIFGNIQGFSEFAGIPTVGGRPTVRALDTLFGGDFTAIFSNPGFNQSFQNEFETISYAGFSQASFDVTPKLTLQAGLRYTKDIKNRRLRNMPKFIPPLVAEQLPGLTVADLTNSDRRTQRFDRWTPSASVSYDLMDDVTLYTSWSRGFRSGGFNESNTDLVEEFDKETLDTYEVGIKSLWFNDRLLLNLTGYYSNFDNMQVDVDATDVNGAQQLRRLNAAEATIQGFDFEFELRPSGMFRNLELAGGIGYIDARYDKFRTNVEADFASDFCPQGPGIANCPLDLIALTDGRLVVEDPSGRRIGLGENDETLAVGPFAQALNVLNAGAPVMEGVDRSNLRLQNTPQLSYNLRMIYTLDLADWGEVETTVLWYHQNKTFQNFFNTVKQGTYGELSAGIDWRLPDGKTRIGFFMENILDRRYVTGTNDNARFDGSNEVFYSRPRTFGFTVSRLFGGGR